MESEILDFGIQNTAQGIWNSTNNWTPESKFHWQRLEFSTWNLESTVRKTIKNQQDGRFRVTGDCDHLFLKPLPENPVGN